MNIAETQNTIIPNPQTASIIVHEISSVTFTVSDDILERSQPTADLSKNENESSCSFLKSSWRISYITYSCILPAKFMKQNTPNERSRPSPINIAPYFHSPEVSTFTTEPLSLYDSTAGTIILSSRLSHTSGYTASTSATRRTNPTKPATHLG